MNANDKERICLGVIVGVHGIKGEVKVKSWTADDCDIGAYGMLENKDASKSFALKVTGHSKDLLRCKIKGIEDRNDAENMVGTELYVNRCALPQLEDDEYYLADLIGLKVIGGESGKEEGRVAGIYNFGAGDVLEIEVRETGKTEMIPFTQQYVPEIHLKEGFIVVSSLMMKFIADENGESESSCCEIEGAGKDAG